VRLRTSEISSSTMRTFATLAPRSRSRARTHNPFGPGGSGVSMDTRGHLWRRGKPHGVAPTEESGSCPGHRRTARRSTSDIAKSPWSAHVHAGPGRDVCREQGRAGVRRGPSRRDSSSAASWRAARSIPRRRRLPNAEKREKVSRPPVILGISGGLRWRPRSVRGRSQPRTAAPPAVLPFVLIQPEPTRSDARSP